MKSQGIKLKKHYLTARENYLKKLRTIKTSKKRTLNDTARVLEGLKLQHEFMLAEKRRLQRTINLLESKGKRVDPKFRQRLKKITEEDKENQERFKLIKEYFERNVRAD